MKKNRMKITAVILCLAVALAAFGACFAEDGGDINKVAGDSGNTVMTTQETTIQGSPEYIECYQEGLRLFDEGAPGEGKIDEEKIREAIEAYKKCFEYSENDVAASLEIVEAYITLRDYEEAKKWLEKAGPYIEREEDKARWLRRHGYIAIEEGKYEEAYAYYAYSLVFGESELAESEIDYIRYMMPDIRQFSAEEAAEYLEAYGIPFAGQESETAVP